MFLNCLFSFCCFSDSKMAPSIVFQCKVCEKILKTVKTLKEHNKRIHKNIDVTCADYSLVYLEPGDNSDATSNADVVES